MNINTDRVGFGTIFVLALYGVVSSSLMPMGRLQEPGPGFFPLALSAILLVLSGLGILSARPSAEDLARLEPFWGDMKTPVKIVLATGLAVLAFEPAGFLITSACFPCIALPLGITLSLGESHPLRDYRGLLGMVLFRQTPGRTDAGRFPGVMSDMV